MKISIIGSGSWGVALGVHLSKLGHNIKIWSYSEEEKNKINNERKCIFLPNLIIPEGIYCTLDYKEAIEGTEIILLVTPSKAFRECVAKLKDYVTDQQVIICSKGLEDGTLYTLSEVLKEEIPNVKMGVFSGPSHAEEVAHGTPTAMVIASPEEEILKTIQNTFMNENFRIYTTTDVIRSRSRRSSKKHNSILCRDCISD